jgi:hypothetical protein
LSTVPDKLASLAKLYRERNLLYGDNYKRFGDVMMLLFPNGITLQTKEDHNRFSLFVHIVTKGTRYAEQFKKGGHPDSLDDIAVYAQMLWEIDKEAAAHAAEGTDRGG